MAEYLEVAFRGGLSVSYPHSETILSIFLHITLNDVSVDALAKVYESMNLEVRESRKQLEPFTTSCSSNSVLYFRGPYPNINHQFKNILRPSEIFFEILLVLIELMQEFIVRLTQLKDSPAVLK